MKAQIKKLWIEGLVSGEFPQGQKELRTGDGKYCCLGVLCEVAKRAGVDPYGWDGDTVGVVNVDDEGNEYPAREEHELPDAGRAFGIEDQVFKLMDMNDGVGDHAGSPKTFMQIALWINEHVEAE